MQQSQTTDFEDRIERPIPQAGSITLTGFDNGRYYFRAGNPDQWSNTVEVTVAHHSLGRAFGFFCLGLLLLGILCFTIFYGNRTQLRDKDGV